MSDSPIVNKSQDLDILGDYVHLLLPEDSIELDENCEYEIGYSAFQWCLVSEVEKDSDFCSVFENNQTLEFVGYGGLEDYSETISELDVSNFRLPDVSLAFREQTLIVSDKALSVLKFSEKLGVTKGTAVLTDPFGQKHTGFHYISFHRTFETEKAAKRLQRIEASGRPLFILQNEKFSELVMVHTSVLDAWKELGITCFSREEDDTNRMWWKNSKYRNFECWRSYDSLEDWQNKVFDESLEFFDL